MVHVVVLHGVWNRNTGMCGVESEILEREWVHVPKHPLIMERGRVCISLCSSTS